MVWDLRGAMLKKEEMETSRLLDFEFRLRARTMRLLASVCGQDPSELVGQIVMHDDQTILARLAEETGQPVEFVNSRWARCKARARTQLIAERGDPEPHRLA